MKFTIKCFILILDYIFLIMRNLKLKSSNTFTNFYQKNILINYSFTIKLIIIIINQK